MAQKDKRIAQYKIDIFEKLDAIRERLNSYDALGATLSEKTLVGVNTCLLAADKTLEYGFVNDACNEIDNALEKKYIIN
jgi:hypothetical protein